MSCHLKLSLRLKSCLVAMRNLTVPLTAVYILPLHKHCHAALIQLTFIYFSSLVINFHCFLFDYLFTVLPPTTSTSKATKLEDICRKIDEEESSMSSIATNSSQPSRRLIKADFSLFKVSLRAFLRRTLRVLVEKYFCQFNSYLN